MKQASSRSMSTEAAEAVAVSALGYIAADPVLLQRFLALTGLDPAQIRQAAVQPGFLAGVLQFILAHEPTLQAFAGSCGYPPEDVGVALRMLPFGDDTYNRST